MPHPYGVQRKVGAEPRHLFCGALLLTAALCAFGLPATAFAGTPIFQSAFGPDGTTATHFGAPGAIGIDETSHDVYVADYSTGKVDKFDQVGAPTNFSALGNNEITGFSFPEGEGVNQIAVNQSTHDFYVLESHPQVPEGSPPSTPFSKVKAYHADGTPAKFTAIAGEPTALTGFPEATGLAVDSSGDIYVADFPHAKGVEVFKPDGEPLTSFKLPNPLKEFPCNIAVGSAGAVYVSLYPELSQGIDAFIPSQFPVTASTTWSESAASPIDSNETLSLAVDPVTNQLFAGEVTGIAQYEDTGLQLSEFGLFAHSEGIAVDGSTGTVYATDLQDQRQVEIFAQTPPVPPTIDSTYFTDATATEADLRAKVNPNGSRVHYRFQYVTQAAFAATGFAGAAETGEGTLPAASTDQIAAAHIGGLAPDTTYQFRLLAESEGGSQITAEPAPALTTFPTPPPGLPDGRAYEMVSPPQKLGEVLPPEPVSKGSCPFECLPGTNLQLMPMQPSPDGDAVVFTGQPFFAGLSSPPNEYLAGRTADGWTTQSISPLLSYKGTGRGYLAFSADLRRAVLYQEGRPGLPGLSPQAPSDAEGQAFSNLYLRQADGTLVPLVSEAPPHRSASMPATKFQILYGAANAGAGGAESFKHVVFAADDALTAAVPGTAPPAPDLGWKERCQFPSEHCDLYEWVEGAGLRLVSVLPGNAGASSAPVLGSGVMLSKTPTNEGPSVQGAVSDDGRRVFWSDETSGKLYVRVDGARTLEVPTPETCKETEFKSTPEERPCFLAASSSGETVLLSNGRLDELNEAETAYEAGKDLTAGLGGFEGILGGARDLSRIYFVDKAVMTKGTGDLSEGSKVITNLIAATGTAKLTANSPTVTGLTTTVGQFIVGQPISGAGIPPGTTILNVSGSILTLSANATASGSSVAISSAGPLPFAVGQTIAAPGIPPETTVVAAGAGTLEISAAATATKNGAALSAGVPLAAGEKNSEGATPTLSGLNLYAWDQGTTTFIGTLLKGDNETSLSSVSAYGDWRTWESGRTAQVSPDGRYLAFMSEAPLTGYDNQARQGAQCLGVTKCFEVFEYDAAAGTLTCASCNPSGELPLGEAKLSLIRPDSAGFAPLPAPGNLAPQGHGRLFFESADVLSPHDSNGRVFDVYEWEPAGIGSCARAAGCVYLISSGHAANDSLFVNSTPSGDDAFFITRQKLLPQDQDDLLDLYDARVGGGFEESGTAPCAGEACKGPPSEQPPLPTAGSASFAGPGNLKPKKQKKHHKNKHRQKTHKQRHNNRHHGDRGGSR
jgi:hypothetical protein